MFLYRETGIFGEQRRHGFLDLGGDFQGTRLVLVERAGDNRGAHAVDAPHLLVVARFRDARHRGQGHATGRGGDALVKQVPQAPTAVVGIANHHLDFVVSALDALRLNAEKRIVQVAGHSGRRQPRRVAGRGQLQVVAPLARQHRVLDLAHGRNTAVGALQVRGRLRQHVLVFVQQRMRDGRRKQGTGPGRTERDGSRAGDLSRGAVPEPLEVRGENVPLRPQRHFNGGKVGAGRAALDAVIGRLRPVLSDQHGNGLDRRATRFLVRGAGRRRDAPRGGGGCLEVRTHRHGQLRFQTVRPGGGGKSGIADGAGANQQGGRRQRGKHGQHRQVRKAHRPRDRAHHLALHKLVERHAGSGLPLRQGRTAPRTIARQMRGQDAEDFQQRDGQHQCDDHRGSGEQLAPSVVQRQQRGKSNGGGQRPERDRTSHGANSGKRRIDTPQAQFALPCDALSDHNGVVDDNAGGDEQTEHRQRVDAHAAGVEKHDRA